MPNWPKVRDLSVGDRLDRMCTNTYEIRDTPRFAAFLVSDSLPLPMRPSTSQFARTRKMRHVERRRRPRVSRSRSVVYKYKTGSKTRGYRQNPTRSDQKKRKEFGGSAFEICGTRCKRPYQKIFTLSVRCPTRDVKISRQPFQVRRNEQGMLAPCR